MIRCCCCFLVLAQAPALAPVLVVTPPGCRSDQLPNDGAPSGIESRVEKSPVEVTGVACGLAPVRKRPKGAGYATLVADFNHHPDLRAFPIWCAHDLTPASAISAASAFPWSFLRASRVCAVGNSMRARSLLNSFSPPRSP